MKLYYKIMVSSIYSAQNNGFMSDIWKFTSNFYFAFASSIYLLFIYLFINNYWLNGLLDSLMLNLTSNTKYNFILNMFLYFIIPLMSINHYCFFLNDKYKGIIKNYKKSYNKKLFGFYFIFALIFILVIFFTKKS
jgi:hypothetical protein